MHPAYNDLKRRLAEVDDLTSAAALLQWDQQTHMPEGGAEARGRQLATLQRLAHQKFTDEAIGELLDDLTGESAAWPYDSDEASLLRVTSREYARATRIPADFVAEVSSHAATTFSAWAVARPANDFASLRPKLEKSLELSRRYADFFPESAEPIDAHIANSDFGMTAASVGELFAQLRTELVPLVRVIAECPPIDDAPLYQHYPEDAQLRFGEEVARQLGYDFQRGRQDKTHHPFATKFSVNDVRITTRLDEKWLSEGLFGTIHETGHALYEQGVDARLEATPLALGTSAGVHESQSRLWENLVGRSRAFWKHFYGPLQELFPTQLGEVPLEAFYRAINKVQPSLIRTEADEVTYNLHVLLRFDLERALLNGELAVADLPEAWNGRMEADLGLTPPDDRNGVLQDVHWFDGFIGGAFQGYTLGNVMSAQFFAAAQSAHPEIPGQIETGRFDSLREWMRANIYCHGRKFTADELLRRATGGPLSITPYMAYLRRKYGELYGL
ncbi:MAG: carboxypeptidase M32 [Caldilineaceae bacterium]|nr:carboxypeptidase M32 [Caldilineaceae bacterium]HRJ40634.1 carboxypeptidase M32 [Caldilineaceae bacterium]